MTREDPLGRAPGMLRKDHAVTLKETLETFTINGARAMGLDQATGSLAVGKSSDFVVPSQNPFPVGTERIVDTHAVQTWFAGKLVYCPR